MPNAAGNAPGKYRLEQFHRLFHSLSSSKDSFILIGGQAVNYWAERYISVEPNLVQFAPFTSSDIDFLGTRQDVAKIASILGRQPVYPSWHALTILAGTIPCLLDVGETAIEVVRAVPRATAAEVRSTSIKAEHSGFRLEVINPIVLLRSKADLARTVNQTDRQDVHHLRIMLKCTRAFLQEVLLAVESGHLPAREWLNLVKDLLAFTESDLGRNVAKEHNIDWTEILPTLPPHYAPSPSIRAFYDKRVQQWQSRMNRNQASDQA